MTDEELKDTIVYIATSRTFTDSFGDEIVIDREVARAFADALIAAGLKFDVNYSFTAAFNSVQAERERDLERRLTAAEHRAEVAEKALLTACIKMVKDEKSDVNIELLVGVIYRKYLKQAEKELEGKDD